jgi:2-(1,2-epoxy-1,2-dihydrophenyl)acetyl-CoA isomerase
VRTLSLNRPAALNSFTTELHAELLAALESAAADEGVRCVVLTGAGRAFCAGQDLADPSVAPDPTPGAAPKDLGHVISTYYAPLVARLRSMPVPVVAAVNGVAAGAGANLALCCDLVVAGRSASFIQAFTKIGLVPDTGGTWLLPRLVGSARALGIAMLGDKLPAEEARPHRPDLAVRGRRRPGRHGRRARRQSAGMPVAAPWSPRARPWPPRCTWTWKTALAEEARLQRDMGSADDYREGVRALSAAKRAPVFKDR